MAMNDVCKPSLNSALCLGFELDGEHYAVDVGCVHSIVRPSAVTRVPGAHPFLLGLINFRSNIVPLVGIGRCFSLPDIPVSRESRVVVIDRKRRFHGILVDRVLDVFERSQSTVIDDVVLPTAVDQGYFTQFLSMDDISFAIIDVDRILTDVVDDERSGSA